jgi:hypothetical protein
VQVDPIKPMLKPPGTKHVKLKFGILLSTFDFKFNLRRHAEGEDFQHLRVSSSRSGEGKAWQKAMAVPLPAPQGTRGANARWTPIPHIADDGRLFLFFTVRTGVNCLPRHLTHFLSSCMISNGFRRCDEHFLQWGFFISKHLVWTDKGTEMEPGLKIEIITSSAHYEALLDGIVR